MFLNGTNKICLKVSVTQLESFSSRALPAFKIKLIFVQFLPGVRWAERRNGLPMIDADCMLYCTEGECGWIPWTGHCIRTWIQRNRTASRKRLPKALGWVLKAAAKNPCHEFRLHVKLYLHENGAWNLSVRWICSLPCMMLLQKEPPWHKRERKTVKQSACAAVEFRRLTSTTS